MKMRVRWHWRIRSRKTFIVLALLLVALGVYQLKDGPIPRLIYRRLAERRLQDALRRDKGRGCEIPWLDPLDREVTKLYTHVDKIVCNRSSDWVSCKLNKCRVKETILRTVSDIECTYKDIVYVTDRSYHLGEPTSTRGACTYELVKSDYAEVICTGKGIHGTSWKGLVAGFRDVAVVAPPGREVGYNILMLAFDSTSKNGFIRGMPLSYSLLRLEMGAVIMNGYNIAGDGTVAAMLPIMTGHTELELPDVRKGLGHEGVLDTIPFLWSKLEEDGYRTAYLEDSPWIGTFQMRFTGFQRQPTHHYLRPFFQQYHGNLARYSYNNSWHCVGDTPSHAFMMNLTRQFINSGPKSKKFIFTFIADITHDDYNFLSTADEDLVRLLLTLRRDGTLNNTLLIVMGDHGPRYTELRRTVQGRLEERLPLMAFVLPKSFVRRHPTALDILKANADVLTTPFDLHNTLLDFVGLNHKMVHARTQGADLPRSMSMLREIPQRRSCSEAGLESHWCTCLKWERVSPAEQVCRRAGRFFVDYINRLTKVERAKCVERTLTFIESASRLLPEENIGKRETYYQIKVIVDPGYGMYEASLSYNPARDAFHLTARDISRINAYNNESSCVTATRPDLSMYCYCKPHSD